MINNFNSAAKHVKIGNVIVKVYNNKKNKH